MDLDTGHDQDAVQQPAPAADAIVRSAWFDVDEAARTTTLRPCRDLAVALVDDLHAFAGPAGPVATDVTTVVPVYNTPVAYLHYCLLSLAQQSVLPHELLVIDDGSTAPETTAYLRALDEVPGVRLIRNPANLSLGPTMNNALRAARTRFVLKLDSDDVAHAGLVAALVRGAARYDDVHVLGTQMAMFGAWHEVTAHPELVTRQRVVGDRGFWFVNHTGVLLDREAVLAVGGYRALRGLPEDYDLWIRMMRRGFNRFRNLPEVLVDYRVLPTGLHATMRKYAARALLLRQKYSLLLARGF